ncbi:MAG: hypothetical protein ACREXU_19495 [Gammaproteobacteria bacterium]
MRPLFFTALLGALLSTASPALAIDWLTAPSHYTHEPLKGQRVTQYSPIGPFYYYERPDFVRSGYRHYRSTIQAGGSADNLHIVEEWGHPVIPYEAWRFPYRPYGVPYDAWGPPFGGYIPFAPGFFGGFGPGHGHGTGPGPNPLTIPGNVPAPWFDGHWPSYDRNDRSGYFEPYPSGPASP